MKHHRKYIIVIIILLHQQCSFSQHSFTNQKSYKPYGISFIDTAKIDMPSFTRDVLEIRFWKVVYTNTAHQLFVLKLSKQNQWQLKKFSFCSWDWKNFSAITESEVALSKDWHMRWDTLIKSHFLTIPTQTEVEKKWRSSDGTVSIIADGHKYIVELLTKKKKRKYSYTNPEANMQHYDLNNQELLMVNNILKKLDDELRFSSVTNGKCN